MVKNHEGRILLIVLEHLRLQSSHFAEARAAWITLSCIHRLGCKIFIITRDSSNIINMLKGEISPGWEIKILIEETSQIIGQFDNVKIEHNFHETNSMANKIANEMVDLEQLTI